MYGLIELQRRKLELMTSKSYIYHHLMTGTDGNKYNYFENTKNEPFLYTMHLVLVNASERVKLIGI